MGWGVVEGISVWVLQSHALVLRRRVTIVVNGSQLVFSWEIALVVRG